MNPRVISFNYTLTGPNGKILDSSEGKDPLSFIEGLGHIIPGLEDELVEMKVSQKSVVKVEAAKAYGERQDNLVITVNKKESFGDQEVAVGNQYEMQGDGQNFIFTVVDLKDDDVILDGNHPLAGMDLSFDVEITDIRDATQEELSHGHVH